MSNRNEYATGLRTVMYYVKSNIQNSLTHAFPLSDCCNVSLKKIHASMDTVFFLNEDVTLFFIQATTIL